MASRLVDSLIGACLPRCCTLCGQRTAADVLCPGCLADLPWLDQACCRCGTPVADQSPGARCVRCPPTLAGFDRVWSALAYEYPVDRLVTGAKFGHQLALATILGHLLARRAIACMPAARGRAALVVPVPLHWQRHGARGFNQADEIARPLCRALGLSLAAGICRRVRATTGQTGLGAADRRRNLRGAFEVRRRLDGANVIVVDDVVTTGATAEALAAALRGAGVAHLELWSVARAILGQPAARNV